MPLTFIATNEDGDIIAASTTDPKSMVYAEIHSIPEYQYQFDLTWEQINELWNYRVVNGELILATQE